MNDSLTSNPPTTAVDEVDVRNRRALARCVSGDSNALAELYDREHGRVLRFLARVLRPDHPELDDLLQKTFVTIFRRAETFRGDSKVSTWMTGIAFGHTRDLIKKERRKRLFTEKFSLLRINQQSPMPDENLRRSDDVTQVSAALQNLPPKHRAAFVLSEAGDMTAKEIAAALSTTEGTVWRWTHEAKKTLRANLEKTESSEATS